MVNQKPDSQQEIKVKKAALWQQMMGIGVDFAFYIGIPLFAFIYAGKWLDSKYHQKFFVLIGIFTALGLSSYLIYKKIKVIKDFLDKK